MWLLDANLDIHVVDLLRSFNVECDSAEHRGWKALRNGELVAAAKNAGFHTLLTRDLLFAESASRAWRNFPDLAIILVTLPQLRSRLYIEAFAAAWQANPIRPKRGKLVTWPAK